MVNKFVPSKVWFSTMPSLSLLDCDFLTQKVYFITLDPGALYSMNALVIVFFFSKVPGLFLKIPKKFPH